MFCPQALSASVVCLQAVEGELYDQFLKPELGKLGYEGAFLKLSGKKDASVKIGVATFFHSRTFRLLKVFMQAFTITLCACIYKPVRMRMRAYMNLCTCSCLC